MTDSMIERVARASFDFWKATQSGKENLKFEELNNLGDEMDFALAHARAAIEAMREPTDAMLDAAEDTNKGGGVADNGGGEPDIYDLEEVWAVMIDAALKENSVS